MNCFGLLTFTVSLDGLVNLIVGLCAAALPATSNVAAKNEDILLIVYFTLILFLKGCKNNEARSLHIVTRTMDLSKTYLVQLFRHSKFGAFLLVVFMLCYAWVLHKKMSITGMPYNDMFSTANTEPGIKAHTNAVFVNDKLAGFTKYPYWKKDLIEVNLANFQNYIAAGHKTYQQSYLASKNLPADRQKMFSRICPDSSAMLQWHPWLMRFMNQPGGSKKISYYSYTVDFSGQKVQIDSVKFYEALLP